MKKVMVFGTFDIFHPGHQSLLKQARKYGDYLVVVIARDKTVEFLKKQKPKNNEEIRKKVVEESGLADLVELGSLDDKYQAIKKYKPDVIALGYDQEYMTESLSEKLHEMGLKTEIVRLKAYKPEIYKSSKLRK